MPVAKQQSNVEMEADLRVANGETTVCPIELTIVIRPSKSRTMCRFS